MTTKNNEQNAQTKGADANKKHSGKKVINTDRTPVTQKVKAKSGTTLHNEGTNISYEEER